MYSSRYEERIGSRRDFNTDWIRRHLPPGYAVHPEWGRWDLLKAGRPIRSGIATRWEVERIARLHAAGRPLPYRYSSAWWKDVARGKRCLWARIVWFVRWNFLIWP